MKKWLSKIFNDKSQHNSLISFEVLNELYSYLYYENASVNFKLKGFFDKIYINRYSFPESFDNPKSISEAKSCGFSGIYEVLNQVYNTIDITPLTQDLIDENYPVDLIHIQFYSNIITANSSTKNILQNFLIFFCCDDGSVETNGFRILYANNRYFTSYFRNLLDSKYILNNIPEGEIEEKAFNDFETVLLGTSQYLKFELPNILSQSSLLFEEATQSHFEELIRLIGQEAIDENQVSAQAKKMFKKSKSSQNGYDFIENNFDFLQNINSWHSDWKFDPEDAEYFISEMIGKPLKFEYPDETYSHDLFPYIQKALAQWNLQLMNFNTLGDDYLFFVVNKDKVDRILELAEIIDVDIQSV